MNPDMVREQAMRDAGMQQQVAQERAGQFSGAQQGGQYGGPPGYQLGQPGSVQIPAWLQALLLQRHLQEQQAQIMQMHQQVAGPQGGNPQMSPQQQAAILMQHLHPQQGGMLGQPTPRLPFPQPAGGLSGGPYLPGMYPGGMHPPGLGYPMGPPSGGMNTNPGPSPEPRMPPPYMPSPSPSPNIGQALQPTRPNITFGGYPSGRNSY